MAMAEKTVPWWRRALKFALGGLRSGFGLFQRGAKPGEVEEGEAARGAEAGEAVEAKEGLIPEEAIKKEQTEAEAIEEGKIAEEPAPEEKVEAHKLEEAEEAAASPENEAGSAEVEGEAPNEDKVEETAEAVEAVEDSHERAPTLAAENDTPEPIATVDEPEEQKVEALQPEAAAEAFEVESAPVSEAIEVEAAHVSGEIKAEPEAEEIETNAPVESIEADDAAKEELIDENRAEELEQVEAEATVAATRANEPEEEQLEEVKTVGVAAGEPVAPAHSAEPEVAHVEEPAKEEEVELHAAAVEEPVPGEERMIDEPVHSSAGEAEDATSEAPVAARAAEQLETPMAESVAAEENVAEAHEALKEEPAHDRSNVVDIDASGEMVEAHIAEHAEDLLAEEAATATHTEKHEGKQPASMEEFDTPALDQAEQVEPEGEAKPAVEAEAKAEPKAEARAEAEAVVEAAAEAVAAPAQMELIPKPPVDEKAAAKKAEQDRRRKEAEEESPFSVMVDHVYDGPLDLLLDLIRKQDIDVYDIPIAKITAQFLAYVNQLKASDVDVAGEFIYTASLLIHIKSKMLLPRTAEAAGEAAEDPRRELVERLLEHERFKNAAQMLQQKQMMEAASWSNPGYREFVDDEGAEPEIAADTVDLVRVFREILERARNRPVLDVAEDTVTVGQMIRFLGRRLTMEDRPIALRKLLSHTRSERALIAMFLALLELVRLQAILLRQDRAFSEIFVKKHSGFDAVMNEGLANARDDWR
jgi:segregation and condensation protein A